MCVLREFYNVKFHLNKKDKETDREDIYSFTSKYLYVGFSYPLICMLATCRSSGVMGAPAVCGMQ